MFILEKADELLGKSIFYIEQPEGVKNIVFMHGKSYTAKDFLKLNKTIESLYSMGYRFYAFDFPGFGKSEINNVEQIDFMDAFIKKLNLQNTVLVGASMSGGFALKYANTSVCNVKAVIAMAPAWIEDEIESFSLIKIPTLLMWGENDSKVDPAIGQKLINILQNSQLKIFKGLSHPFYFENEEVFRTTLVDFLSKLEV